MDRRMFVTVFAAVGCALAALLVAMGVVQATEPESSWWMVWAGVLLAVLVGAGAWLASDLGKERA